MREGGISKGGTLGGTGGLISVCSLGNTVTAGVRENLDSISFLHLAVGCRVAELLKWRRCPCGMRVK